MKKFLTVLLALSVVFTYTVGTAFAAVSADRNVESEAAAKVSSELDKVKAAETLYLGSLPASTNDMYDVDKDVKFNKIVGTKDTCFFDVASTSKVTKKVVDAAEEALNQQYATVVGNTYTSDAELDTALASIKADDYYGADKFGAEVAALSTLKALELQYAQERYTAYVNAVNEDDYSDVIDENDPNAESNKSKVIALKKEAIEGIEAATDAYATSQCARAVAEAFADEIATINTKTDDSYDVADLEAAKDIAVAKVTADYAEAKANALAEQNDIIRQNERANPQTQANKDNIAQAKEAIETINEQYDATLQLLVDQIKAVETISDDIYYAGGYSAGPIGTIVDYKYTYNTKLSNIPAAEKMALAVKKVEKIDELKADAELAKKQIGIEGSKYYSVEEVEDALDAAIAEVYPAKDEAAIEDVSLNALTPAKALEARIQELTGENGKAKVVIANKAYDTIKAWTDALTAGDYTYNGSDDTKDAIEELAKATKTALDEATSVEEAEKIFLDAYEKYDAYLTKDEYNDLYKKDGELYAKSTSYEKQIEAAVAAKHTLVDPSGAYNFDNKTGEKGAFEANLIAEMKKATTAADLDAKYAEAIAVVDNLKTVEALSAEAKAMNDKVATIDKTDKAAVTALADEYADFKDYVKLIDTNKPYVLYDARVKTYLQDIANAEAKAINDAIKAIGPVTVEDKEAVEKVVADKEALDTLMDDYSIASTTPTVGDVDKLEADLSNAEVKAVRDEIATMEMTTDPANIAKIRALQADYDALKTSQKAKITGDIYDKYVALGKLADKYDIASVEALKITASSSAKKGSITVKWKVTGDASAVTYFDIRKSTKLKSGFGNKPYFKTKDGTVRQYKNTKGLKKGTRYFYKVRAVAVIDGVEYTSDWSNKAYRIAK